MPYMAFWKNCLLVSFLKGGTGISGKDETDKKLNALMHAVEHVYYAQNLNICVNTICVQKKSTNI